MTLSWHQQRAGAILAAEMRSGKEVPHGMRACDCCGDYSNFGPLDDSEFKCSTCEETDCDPAQTWHCFTGHCDGSGCSFHGECELGAPWDFSAEYSTNVGDVRIELEKVGGGYSGDPYPGQWRYRLLRDGEPFYGGRDLYCGDPHTHDEMARVLRERLEASHVIPALV